MTVNLTIFRDGSAILAIARSHSLADGTTTWAFVGDWAAACRGETLSERRPYVDRGFWNDWLMDYDAAQKICKDEFGGAIVKKWWTGYMVNAMMRSMDIVFKAGLSKTTARTRLAYSNEDLERIKRAASPPDGSPGDGWVTTQEAISAHLLLCLGRAILPAGKVDAVTGVKLWLDVRKLLGIPGDASSGFGFSTGLCTVEKLLEKTLWQVANAIHDELKKFPAEFKKMSGVFTTLVHRGLGVDLMASMMSKDKEHPTKGKFDVLLQLNNQAKRVMPDFGDAGGVPSAVLTNAGPSLILPTKDGVELFLVKDVFEGATDVQKAEALRLMTDTSQFP
jgi:hypothetical protein